MRQRDDQGSDPGAQGEQSIIFPKAQILFIGDPELLPFLPAMGDNTGCIHRFWERQLLWAWETSRAMAPAHLLHRIPFMASYAEISHPHVLVGGRGLGTG